MEEFLTQIWPNWQEYSWAPLVLYLFVILAAALKSPTGNSNPVYVFIYRLINYIAMNIGRAKNADDVNTKTGNKTLLVLLLAIPLFASGCALKTMEPHEQGVAITQELTEAYYVLEQQYFYLPHDTQTQVAPYLDKYRLTLVLLRDCAAVWYDSKIKPPQFDTLLNSVSQIAKDINLLIEPKMG